MANRLKPFTMLHFAPYRNEQYWYFQFSYAYPSTAFFALTTA
ncbi:hypothetical protein HMPREF9545_03385 [Escherichia coli MS 16-3]|nr:hypothetical protein HMPREF9545_03385 [Escherichia coli MS 16-3]ESD37052.1 hypothetical protein HMPREF1604_03891 [Escherichia coli 908519]